MASISGKNASGTIGGNVIGGCHQWEFRETVDDLDGTAGEDGGYQNPDAGVGGGTVTIRCWFDKSRAAYVPIRAGTYVEALALYDDVVNDSPCVDIPLGVVMESSKTAETRGRIEISATIKTKGFYDVLDPT